MSDEHYKQGENDCVSYYASQGFAGLTRHIEAEDAMRLFFSSEIEQMVQFAPPLPKWRKDWIRGFKDKQKQILSNSEG